MNSDSPSHLNDERAVTEVALKRRERAERPAPPHNRLTERARALYLVMLLASLVVLRFMAVDITDAMQRGRAAGPVAGVNAWVPATPGPVMAHKGVGTPAGAEAAGAPNGAPAVQPPSTGAQPGSTSGQPARSLEVPGAGTGSRPAGPRARDQVPPLQSPSTDTRPAGAPAPHASSAAPGVTANQSIAGLPLLGPWPPAIVTIEPERPGTAARPMEPNGSPAAAAGATRGSLALPGPAGAEKVLATAVPPQPVTDNPSGAAPEPALAAGAAPLPDPAAALASLAGLAARVAGAEAGLQSGQIVATVLYGNGSQASLSMVFDVRSSPPRTHFQTSYQGGTQSYTVEQIVIGDQQWLRGPSGQWCRQPAAGTAPWGQVQAYLPHVSSARGVRLANASGSPVLAWTDTAHAVHATLKFDPVTGIPQEMEEASRPAHTQLIVRYAGWNTPVDVHEPAAASSLPLCAAI